MKSILSLATVLLLTVSPLFAGPLEDLQSNTVHISAGFASGSGVLVRDEDGTQWVWTVAHVVRHVQDPDGTFSEVGLHTPNGQEARGEVVRVNYDLDLAVILVRGNLNAPGAIFAGCRGALGNAVFCCSCPGGIGGTGTLVNGIVSFVDRNGFLQTSTPTFPGSSGGPVFLPNGQVVGLVSCGMGETFTLSVPVETIRQWARQVGVDFTITPLRPPLLRDLLSGDIEQ